MKKKIIYSILLVSLFFFNVNIVFAENSTSCAYQQQQINSYNSLKNQLESIDCTDTSTESTVTTCNENQMEQNVIITELMKLNDEGNICSSLQDDVDSIIEENEDRCGQIFDSDFSDFIDRCMAIFYILGPILLILFGSLDFAKATVSGDEKSLRKAWKTFSKRIAATLLLFLAPFIVNVIVSLNASDKYLSGNAYSCDYSYSVYTRAANIEYNANLSSSSNSISSVASGDLLDAADAVHSTMENEKWSYSVSSTLYWNNIEKSLNNPNKVTCCATFVGVSLYVAEIFTESEMNSFNYNSSQSTYNYLKNNGWTQITNFNSLQAGDIVFMTRSSSQKKITSNIGHVQIYAGTDSNGNRIWYNAGSTKAITRTNPYVIGDSYVRGRFVVAMRQ